MNKLKRHIEIQTEAIANLPPDVITSESTSITGWEEIRKEFWGKDLMSLVKLETVQRGENPISDNTLPKKIPSFPILEIPKLLSFAFGISGTKIMVRSEYNDAEQEALLSVEYGHKLFLVKGSPGIGTIPFSLLTAGDNISSGKSTFLLWLLLRRLEHRLPTVLQVCGPDLILLCESGVYELMQPGRPQRYVKLAFLEDSTQKIWALFKPNPAIPQPAAVLMMPTSPFFVVQTNSPNSRYQDWHKTFCSRSFYMRPWSLLELIQWYAKRPIGVYKTYTLYSRQFFTPSLTEYRLQHFYDRFGVSPRELDGLAKDQKAYEAHLLEEINEIPPADIRHLFNNPGSYQISHLLATLYPSPENRSMRIVVPASLHIFDLLLEKHLQARIGDMEYIYDLLRGSKIGAAAAGLVFERRMHAILPKKTSLLLYPICCANPARGRTNLIFDDYKNTVERTDGKEYRLPDLQLRFLETGTTKLQEDTYHTPKSLNFPTVDSLLFFNPLDPPDKSPVLFMCQMTQAQTHDVKVKGLQHINNLDLPKNVRKFYVAVTPDDTFTRLTVPLEYFAPATKKREAKRLPNEVFPVLHYPVPRKDMFPQRESFTPIMMKP